MYRLYGLIAQKAAHGKNMRRPFSFSKQIKPVHEGKAAAFGGRKFFYPVIYELYYSYRTWETGAKPFFY
jgi:hypothetical protein